MGGCPLFFVISFGLLACGAFGVATYVGGWLAYGCGVAVTLVLACVAAWIGRKRQIGLRDALEAMAAGHGGVDACEAVTTDHSLRKCADAMSERYRLAVFYESAFRELRTPALVCDPQGSVQLATESMLALVEKNMDQVVGQSVSRVLYDKDGASMTEAALEGGSGVEEDAELVLWNGRSVAVRVFISLVHDSDGEVVGAVTAFVEQTERYLHQEEMEKQRECMIRAGERVSGLAEHVASATELLSASADDQAQGAQSQRQQISSVAAAMEQMMETVMEVARNAEATRQAATDANDTATGGRSMVDAAVKAINQVAEQAVLLEREVGELDVQAGAIGQILGVINDIADQTNLLALNAAIEAARAGDAGRGFAVVADEVRKLAEKTVDATRDVESAIESIQSRSKSALMSMEATAKQVSESTELSGKAGEALQSIMEGTRNMVERVAEIATVAGQQSSATEQVMQSMEEIATIAEDADEAAGQAAAATRDMADLARDLLHVSKDFGEGGVDRELREPAGKMTGLLPGMVQDFVREKYGQEPYDAMPDELGSQVFVPTDSYPGEVLMQMAESAAGKAGISVRDFFLDLGRYVVVRFSEMYPVFFGEGTLKSFYMRMNDIHAQLTEAQPEVAPPNFTFEDKGDDLFMNYRSPRGLFDFFEGVLLGAAEFKGEKVRVAVKPFDHETARAEIVFLGSE